LTDRDERIRLDAMNAALRLPRALAILPMPDVFTKTKRSEVMSRIKGRGKKETELVLARLFRTEGITGWRRHSALVGRPDFSFRVRRVVVFVDGCSRHMCPKHFNMPANIQAFWNRKLTANQARDRLFTRTLRFAGWRVIRIWEHELRKPSKALVRIRAALGGQKLGRPNFSPSYPQ